MVSTFLSQYANLRTNWKDTVVSYAQNLDVQTTRRMWHGSVDANVVPGTFKVPTVKFHSFPKSSFSPFACVLCSTAKRRDEDGCVCVKIDTVAHQLSNITSPQVSYKVTGAGTTRISASIVATGGLQVICEFVGWVVNTIRDRSYVGR